MDKLEYDENWSVLLRALYYDREGNWQKAHDLVDQLGSADAAHIHAYLHRKEGDQWNAEYWYRRAGQNVAKDSLDEEWNRLWEKYTE
jgi:hypothetical protein